MAAPGPHNSPADAPPSPPPLFPGNNEEKEKDGQFIFLLKRVPTISEPGHHCLSQHLYSLDKAFQEPPHEWHLQQSPQ